MPKIWKKLSSTLASLSGILPDCKNIINFTATKQMSKKVLLLGNLLLNTAQVLCAKNKEKSKKPKGFTCKIQIGILNIHDITYNF